MILFCSAVAQAMPLPWTYWLVMVGFTLIITGLLPISLILYQVHRGDIADIYITNRGERTLAYVETGGCFAFWWYMLSYTLHAPLWLSGVALGGTIAIVLVAVINHWWKISAHLTGMGGLIGGILTYQLSTAQLLSTFHFPLFTLVIALVITWLVMIARLYLNAHTQWQVIAGFALGLSCTLLIPLCYV